MCSLYALQIITLRDVGYTTLPWSCLLGATHTQQRDLASPRCVMSVDHHVRHAALGLPRKE
jgi:hypothetical protein